MKTKYILLSLMGLIFSACNSNDEIPVDYSDTPVSVNAGVYSATVTTRYSGSAFEGNDQFGLFFDTENVTSTDVNFAKYRAYNMAVSNTDGNSWTTASQLLWKSNSNQVTYFAYFPYDESLTAASTDYAIGSISVSKSLSVSLTQTEKSVVSEDFLYASSQSKYAENSVNGAINVTFSHAMAKLNVQLSKGTALTDASIDKVEVENVYLTNRFSINGGKWDDSLSDLRYTSLSGSGTNFSGLIIPQSLILRVRVYVSGVPISAEGDTPGTERKEYVYTYIPTSTDSSDTSKEVELESGKEYTLSLTVGYDKVDLSKSTITITEWSPTTLENSSLETE